MGRGARILLWIVLASCRAGGQQCATTVLVSFYDQRTTLEIETLKAEDMEVRMDGASLPLLGATRDFHNRLLVLLQTEGAAKNEKLETLVETVTQQARSAPAGHPVAFGIFSEKALFTREFLSDPEQRARAVNAVMEEAGSLGKRVALWDALHQALALFGPHQPGDTILLVGDPYDVSVHGGSCAPSSM